MAQSVLLTMTNPLPGREQEFEDWYGSQHLTALVGVPAVKRGRLHTASEERPYKWRQCAIYDLEGEPVAAVSQIFEYGGAGKMAPAEAMDRESTLMVIATPITESIGQPHDPDNFLFLVLTNPTGGQEEEYNRWYNDQHIADVLAIPGFVGMQRFRLSHHPAQPAPYWNYVAFYEIDRDKVAEAFAGLDAARGTDRMPMSGALKREDNEVALYYPVSTKVQAVSAEAGAA